MKKLSFSLIAVSVIVGSILGSFQTVETASKNDVRGNSIDLTQTAKNEVR